MTLQTRSKYKNSDWTEWKDRPENTLDFTHSAATVEKTEVREKPPFESGWYYHAHTGEHLEFRYCTLHEPWHFPGGWQLITKEKLNRVFGNDINEDEDYDY